MLSHMLRAAANKPGYLTLVDSGNVVAANATSNNITLNLGAAYTNRHVIVCIACYRGADARYITALSLGGNSMTIHADARDSISTFSSQAVISSVILNTGTTATLAVTTGGQVSQFGYFVFVANNASTTTTSTSTAALTSSSTNQTATFTSFNTGSYAIIFGEAGNATTTSATFTYTGATSKASLLMNASASQMNIGVATCDPNKGTITVSTTMSTTYDGPLAAIASWTL